MKYWFQFLSFVLGLLFCMIPARAQISFVNSAKGTGSGSIAISASPPSGDTIVAGIIFRGSSGGNSFSGVTDNGTGGGSTYAQVGSTLTVDSTCQIMLFTATAVASITTITFNKTAGSNDAEAIVGWYSGVGSIGANHTNTGTGTPTTDTLTVSASTSFDVSFAGVDNGPITGSSNTGNLRATEAGSNRLGGLIDNTGSTTLTNAMNFTGSSVSWGEISVELKASGGATCTPTLTLMGVGIKCG